jgi:exopolyphosphatase/pppGpp-phosphohydrolase
MRPVSAAAAASNATAALYRAVFDMGSGTTKLALCARPTRGAPFVQLFGEELETFVGYDVKRSGLKNAISAEMQNHILACVGKLVAQITAFQQLQGGAPAVIQARGFATAVYRECSNGRAVLDAVQRRFGFRIDIATQLEEAMSGFLTGVQLADAARAPYSRVCIWDSGGASFQLSLGERDKARNAFELELVNGVVEGHWGNSKVAHHFMQAMQRKSEEEMAPGRATMNPVSAAEFEGLVAHIRADLDARIKPEQTTAVRAAAAADASATSERDAVPFVAIGGTTSAFALVARAAKRVFGREADALCLTAADMRKLVASEFLGRTDGEIEESYLQRHIAVGKVALLTAVLEYTGYKCLRAFHQSVGTCIGLAGIEESWRGVEPWAGVPPSSKL